VFPVGLSAQPDPSDPFVDEASILTGTDISGMINLVRKDEVFERASSTCEPSEDAAAGRLKKLERNRPAGSLVSEPQC
jgi:hypothetical protein